VVCGLRPPPPPPSGLGGPCSPWPWQKGRRRARWALALGTAAFAPPTSFPRRALEALFWLVKMPTDNRDKSKSKGYWMSGATKGGAEPPLPPSRFFPPCAARRQAPGGAGVGQGPGGPCRGWAPRSSLPALGSPLPDGGAVCVYVVQREPTPGGPGSGLRRVAPRPQQALPASRASCRSGYIYVGVSARGAVDLRSTARGLLGFNAHVASF
jgi:hypothetical protein